MKKLVLPVFFFLAASIVLAQKTSVSGRVTDTTSPLPSATVMLLQASDSTLVNFTVSKADGQFQLKNVNYGNYILQITFVGFETFKLKITADREVIELDQIQMLPRTQQLDEVIVEGEKAPVTVKRDTIEFNAASFKTKPNANVEDLLKKLPGMEIENDGTVKAQGEEVQRVMVDGREFFGRDPKLATRNLPADAVDKVQVFDKKSDQAVFTGIDDGQREKTINLELKEEKRKGAFGTLTAGAGTEERLEGKASINRFTKTKQLSFLGMGNNTNDQGFSMEEYMNFSGGSQQMMGGGGGAMRIEINNNNPNGVLLDMGQGQEGITTNYAGGLNLNKDFSKDTKAGGSFFYNHTDQDVSATLNRINYLPSGNYSFSQLSRQRNFQDNQRLNLTLDHSLDSANSIKFTAYATNANTRNNTFSESQTLDENGNLQNENERSTTSDGAGVNVNSELLFRHRFPRKGRTISATVTTGLSNFNNEGEIGSLNQFYTGTGETENILQRNSQDNHSLFYGITTSYTEPLGGRKYLEANYSYRVNTNDVDRGVWDVSAGQEAFNALLSNKYSSRYTYNRPGLTFRLIRQKFNLMAGASWQSTQLYGDLIYQDVIIDRSFDFALPVVRFNYDFSSFKHFRVDYETSVQEPTIQELQPVINNSDPLNLTVGNPDLKPGYVQRLRGSFTLFDPSSFISMFAFITANYVSDAISSSQEVDANLVRTTKPVNVDNNFSVDGSVHLGLPLRKLKSRIGITTGLNRQQGITLLNSMKNDIHRQTVEGSLRYSYNLDEKINLDLSASFERQKTSYDFDVADQLFLNKTYEAELNLKLLKNYQFNPSFRYLDYYSATTGFSQSVPMLDISFSRFLLKNNVGELKIGVRNALDRNVSINQTANTNYLEQRTSNNLGRYFMVSFTYALNKQLNPMTGRRGMHMIRR